MWMAQDFVGSNNVSLLIPNGQFGTRHQGGKDAASPPLISTSISKLTRLIFHPQDGPLLTHRMYGDQRIEPEFYAPIIPLILVNGTRQIGMSYNPRDITENLKRMLDDEEPIPMDPWFKGGLLKELISTTEMENALQSPDPVQSIEN
ncbi:DNA topoisomerase 2-like [Daphnia pulicaria]|uniref:DNA topoisomerase 2-like n=1 Tax=Daphnia pulicaria TaxID=35523 RepID=UPI001EEA766A|nr:DNA topoisomerase 2-like [Daphnia pulicaria]